MARFDTTGLDTTSLDTTALDTVWTLDKVLHPMRAASFFAEHWERQPCKVSRHDARYYAPLLSVRDLDSLITTTANPSLGRVRMVRSENGRMANKAVPHTTDGIPNMYALYRSYCDEGYTITVDRLDLSWKPVAGVCRSLEDELQHPVAANAYYTPRGAQGFLPHYDTHDVFILQIEGAKMWRLYDYPAGLPLHHETSTLRPEDLAPPRETICLGPGELLYIPRGHVHEAFTSSEPSLHLTIGVHVFRWADLISETIAAVAGDDPRWREALPVRDVAEKPAGMQSRLRELLLALAAKADPQPGLERLSRRLSANGFPLPDGHFCVLDRIDDVTEDTVVWKRDGMTCKVVALPDRVTIHFAGNIIAGPPAIEPALAFVAARHRFTPSDLPDCLEPSDKLVLTRRLIREGLLTFKPVVD
jgi:ribosomal protein L16 Arg81 hydroxylase